MLTKIGPQNPLLDNKGFRGPIKDLRNSYYMTDTKAPTAFFSLGLILVSHIFDGVHITHLFALTLYTAAFENYPTMPSICCSRFLPVAEHLTAAVAYLKIAYDQTVGVHNIFSSVLCTSVCPIIIDPRCEGILPTAACEIQQGQPNRLPTGESVIDRLMHQCSQSEHVTPVLHWLRNAWTSSWLCSFIDACTVWCHGVSPITSSASLIPTVIVSGRCFSCS